jgi:hypothetical protein
MKKMKIMSTKNAQEFVSQKIAEQLAFQAKSTVYTDEV